MSYSILILEDDKELREALVMTLEDEDYQVQGAASGLEALNLASRGRFDLAVADVRMDGVDGIEALSRLKKLQSGLRCIVMTGYAGDDAPARALQVQVEDYLYKPFKARDLLLAIERIQNQGREQATYDGLFGRGPSQKPPTVMLAGEEAQVDAARHGAFRDFYVSLRSGQVRSQQGIQVWDLLEQAERRREELRDSSAPPSEARQKLHQGYRTIANMVSALSHSNLPDRPRGPGQVTVEVFARLCAKIKDGTLSLEQVKAAPNLRRADPVALATNPGLRSLLELVWQTP